MHIGIIILGLVLGVGVFDFCGIVLETPIMPSLAGFGVWILLVLGLSHWFAEPFERFCKRHLYPRAFWIKDNQDNEEE